MDWTKTIHSFSREFLEEFAIFEMGLLMTMDGFTDMTTQEFFDKLMDSLKFQHDFESQGEN